MDGQEQGETTPAARPNEAGVPGRHEHSTPLDRGTDEEPGVPPIPPTGADAVPSAARASSTADPSRVKLGATEFTWPVPDRTVVVSGRSISVEIAVVALLYALVGLWLCWQCRGLVTSLDDLVSGLFSSGLAFAITWIVILVLGLVLYLGVGFLYIAYRLALGDPVGRGLAAIVFAAITLLLFTSARSGAIWTAFIVSGASCAVLFLSPWAARVFDQSPTRRNRPWQVVLAETVAVSYFSVLGLFVVLALPGLRFVGQYGVGAKYVLYILVGAASAAAALVGYRRLRTAQKRQGRLMLTIAPAGAIVAQLFVFTGAGFALVLCVCGAILIPLWVSTPAREWFGDEPTGLQLPIRFEAGPDDRR